MTNLKMKNIYTFLCTIILILSISVSTVNGQNNEGNKKKRITDGTELKGNVIFDFGFNSLREIPQVMGINAFQSKSAGLYYMQQYAIGKKLSFNPALGVTVDKFSFDQNVVLDYFDVDDGTGTGNTVSALAFDSLDASINLKRSKLATAYLEAPIEFRYYFKGNESNDGFYLALGGFAGIRLETHTKIKFDEDGIKKVEKKRGEFHQKKIRYGLHGRIGYRGINLFYKQSFSTIFGDQGPAGSENAKYSTIGISISGL